MLKMLVYCSSAIRLYYLYIQYTVDLRYFNCFLMLNVLKISTSSHHGIFHEKIFNLQWQV